MANNKIYIVTSGEYSDYGIEAVFTDKYEAEKYCATENLSRWSDCRVEEYEVYTCKCESREKMLYEFVIWENAIDTSRCRKVVWASPEYRNSVEWNYRYYAYVYIDKDDPELAFKIAKDMIAKEKADKSGISL